MDTNKSLKDRIIAIDNGRFTRIAEAVELKDECLYCTHFNKSAINNFSCCVLPKCIGVTLSERTNRYILRQLASDGHD